MSNPFRILLVEDNSDDEHLILRTLRSLGANVVIDVARDGQEALDVLASGDSALPDLVLLDLKLPKISGLNILCELRIAERTENLRIVVLSCSHEPDEVRNTYTKYADASIEKPISLSEFSRVLTDLGFAEIAASVST